MHFHSLFKAILSLFKLVILADQNDVFANNIDPDETAHIEPSHEDLHSLAFCFNF